MLTPVGSLVLAAIILGQKPTWLQLLGCVLALASAYAASTANTPWRLLKTLKARRTTATP